MNLNYIYSHDILLPLRKKINQIDRRVRPSSVTYFRVTLYVCLYLLVPPTSFPSAFLRHCGPIDTRRCRSNHFPHRLVRYIPDAITGSAICHAATPADISEYPPVIMRLFVKFTREDQSLAIESRYPATNKKNGRYFQRKRVKSLPASHPPSPFLSPTLLIRFSNKPAYKNVEDKRVKTSNSEKAQ